MYAYVQDRHKREGTMVATAVNDLTLLLALVSGSW